MKYFNVEKEYLAGNVSRYEVSSNGTEVADKYIVESEECGTKMVLGFLVNEYNEEWSLENARFYPVKSDTSKEPLVDDTGEYVWQNNENEVLAKIYEEYSPSEWQNDNW